MKHPAMLALARAVCAAMKRAELDPAWMPRVHELVEEAESPRAALAHLIRVLALWEPKHEWIAQERARYAAIAAARLQLAA